MSPTNTARCATGCARQVEPAALVCRSCRDRAEHALATLPGLYAEAGRLLNGSVAGPTERVSGKRTPGIPLNGRSVELRARIRGILACWAQLVVDEREVRPPARDIEPMARFLRVHLDWLVTHEAAADLVGELVDLRTGVLGLVRPDTSRRIVIGCCLHPGCPGELIAWMRPRDSHLPSEIKCTQDTEHVWPADQWTRLRRMLAPTG